MANYNKSHGVFSSIQRESYNYNWPIGQKTAVFEDKYEPTEKCAISKRLLNKTLFPGKIWNQKLD